MDMIDLCAGTGAFSIAFESTGNKIVFANDYAKNSKNIYDKNFQHKLTLGDLFQILPENIPKHKILAAGFPCQSFSMAGNRLGFEDTRGSLFFKILEIIDYHNPEILIFENVKGLINHDGGNTLKIIIDNIETRNYYVKWNLLNTSELTGIPQNRERIYIVCFKNKEHYKLFNFDFENVQLRPLNNFLEKTIPTKYYYTDKVKVYPLILNSVTKENIIYQYRRTIVRENKSGVCPTLTANMGTGGHNVPLLKDSLGIRKLTPRECFNLQGFPETYIFPDNISDSKLYQLAGNSVTLPIIQMIAEKIRDLQ
jgi:DNA (cytosine-5)-methyltransferase 1